MHLPEGYKKLDEYKLSRDLAINMQFLGGAAAFFCFIIFQMWADFSVKFWNAAPIDFPFYLVVLATVATGVIHELVHGLGVKWAGGKPKYGAGVAFWVLPYFYCTSDGYFPRNKFIVFAAMPSLILTPIFLLLIFLLPQVSQLLVFPAVFNFVGGVGDAWLIKNVLRYPKHVYVLDQKHSNTVYGKDSDKALLTEKKVSVPFAFFKGLFEGLLYFFFVSIFLGVILTVSSVYLKNLPFSSDEANVVFYLPVAAITVLVGAFYRAWQAKKAFKSTSHAS